MSSNPSPQDHIRKAPCPTCIVCGSGGVELYDGLTDYLAGTQGDWRIVRCADVACGMLWLDPMPLAADLIKAYASYHTHGSVRAGGVRRLALSALNSFCRIVSRVLESGSGLARQRRQLRTMFICKAPAGSLLEVGCGAGRFLNRMRAAGWRVQGTDFDTAAAAHVMQRYGLQVDVGHLADLRYPSEAFDVVAMSQVIEHVHNPQALLMECLRLLRPGGRMVLTTPNALALAHLDYGRYWRGLEPPRHLHVFTPIALERCASSAGFVSAELRTLSAESAGIYRASGELRDARHAKRSWLSEAAAIVGAWRMRYFEYRQTLLLPYVGQDILYVGIKKF
ncbi:MAG: class I SAM-dependent methyltransferase [Burkholderiales bacterium]